MAEEPPKYQRHENAVDRLTPEERLKSLQEYAEQQKYVKPGDGTLPTGPRGLAALAFGGPLGPPQSAYTTPLPPPSYDQGNSSEQPRKKSAVGRWLDRRRGSKSEASNNPTSSQTQQQS